MAFDHRVATLFLEKLSMALRATCTPFFLMQGTALGAHRDRGFTPTERDIDLGVLMPFRFVPLLEALARDGVKCETRHRWINGRCHTIVASWCGVKADIVGWYEIGDKLFAVAPDDVSPHYCIVHDRSTIIGQIDDTEMRVKCWGLELTMPNDVEKYLEAEYGPDWRTPREDHVSRTRIYGFLTKELRDKL